MRPNCPTCNQQLSTGASQNGKARFFCINRECEDRFKVIAEPKENDEEKNITTAEKVD